MKVVLYSKPGCVQCVATSKALEKKGIVHEVVDLTKDQKATEWVQAQGYRQVPVVLAGEQHWSGFRPDLISALS